jgi:hypothetical protein
MLYIDHTPLYGTKPGKDGYEINATIYPYSEENLITESTGVYWKVEGESWDFVHMESLGNDEYKAVIPFQENGSVVQYYIHAEDESGKKENHPYIGAPMAYSFTTYSENEPPEKPTITGPTDGKTGETYTYCLSPIVDPDGDDIFVFWDWGDNETSGWLGPYAPGQEICASHSWTAEGTYVIRAKVKDEFDAESDWAELAVTIPMHKTPSLLLKIVSEYAILKRIMNF